MEIDRCSLATEKKNYKNTQLIWDKLPALEEGEIRMEIDRVGLTSNNQFYFGAGSAPFLNFFAIYPIKGNKKFANVPAWGVGTVVDSRNSEFKVGEQFSGMLHMANYVQMKAGKKNEDGSFVAAGGGRGKLNPLYNVFEAITEDSPTHASGEQGDLAMTAAPGWKTSFYLLNQLRRGNYYGAKNLVITSASSKVGLAVAFGSKKDREEGGLEKVIGYTSKRNYDFVESTGLFDEVLSYDDDLPAGGNDHLLLEICGTGVVYRHQKKRYIKAFAIGQTDGKSKKSIFTEFSPSGLIKLTLQIMNVNERNWFMTRLNPRLEMYFGPSTHNAMKKELGKKELNRLLDATGKKFVDASIENGWIQVNRCEDLDTIINAYLRIFEGEVPPSEAVVLSFKDFAPGKSGDVLMTQIRAK